MGAASSFKNRIENHSQGVIDLPGVDHLGQLTPFQNQVLDAAIEQEAKQREQKREERMNQAQAGGGRQRNPRAQGQSSQLQQTVGDHDTVRYVNKQQNPDHPVFQDDD